MSVLDALAKLNENFSDLLYRLRHEFVALLLTLISGILAPVVPELTVLGLTYQGFPIGWLVYTVPPATVSIYSINYIWLGLDFVFWWIVIFIAKVIWEKL